MFDVLKYVNETVKKYDTDRRVAFRNQSMPGGMGTEAGTIPVEFDELSDREREYYQTGPWSTREDYRKGQLVQPGPGRQGYQGVKAKHLGSGLFETTYPGGSKTYFGQIMRKGKRLKFNNKDKNKVLEWLEETKKLKAAPSVVQQQQAEGLLLDKPKYKKALEEALDEVFAMQEKGYGGIRELTQKYKDMFSKKGKIQYGRKLTTDITTEGTALVNAIRSQAKKLDIDDLNTKKLEKALDFYRNKKIINRGDIAKISKKFDVNYNTFSRTLFEKDYRRKIPLKYGSEAEKKKAVAKAYNYAKKIYSSPRYENLIIGTPETQLGHATDLYTQYVTPEDLVYTPAKINQEAVKEIDAAQNSIYEKRAKLFKNKPAGWQKEVERLNAKGMFLADKSQGYKNFNVQRVDGSTYKHGVHAAKTIDPLGTFEGKELKSAKKVKFQPMTVTTEVLEGPDKGKITTDKKVFKGTKTPALTSDPVEQYFFEKNRKAVFKAQDKMGKRQIKTIIERIGCPGKAAGGRASFADGSTCYSRGLEKVKAGNIKTPGEKANFSKLAKIAGGAKNLLGKTLAGAFGPTGAAGLWYGFGGVDLKDPWDRGGLAAEAALAPSLVKSTEYASKGIKNPLVKQGVQRALNLGMSLPMAMRAARIASPIGWLSLAGEGIYHAGKRELERRGQMSPQELEDFHLERQSRGWSRMGRAGGGIAGLSGGKRFGPPPESGPMPQGGGLSSQFNRVKKLTG